MQQTTELRDLCEVLSPVEDFGPLPGFLCPHVPVVVSSIGPRAFCPVRLKFSGVFLRLHKMCMFYLCF